MNRRSAAESFEKIPTFIFDHSAAAAAMLAREVRDLIESRNREGKPAVLGLATGSTSGAVLPRTHPPAHGGEAQLQERHHLQPRRILRPASRTIRRATAASCATSSSTTSTSRRRTSTSPTAPCRAIRSSTIAAPTRTRSTPRAASTSRSSASAAPATSASTNRDPRRESLTRRITLDRDHAAGRRRGFPRRGERPALRHHHGCRHHSARQEDRAHGLGRKQGRRGRQGRRGTGDGGRLRLLPPGSSRCALLHRHRAPPAN